MAEEQHMSREEALKMLAEGRIDEWNSYRDKHRGDTQGCMVDEDELQWRPLLSTIDDPANLSVAHLTGANLELTDLRGANLRGAILQGANLYGADLRDADLSLAKLRDADLYGAQLRRVTLHDTDLRWAALTHANLRNASIRECDFTGAILSGVDLRDAELDGVIFDRAILYGARVRGAVLRNIKWDGALLFGALLSGADLGEPDLRLAYEQGALLDDGQLEQIDATRESESASAGDNAPPQSFKVYVDPGEASTKAIRNLLIRLSDLNIALGGLGFEFKSEILCVNAVPEVQHKRYRSPEVGTWITRWSAVTRAGTRRLAPPIAFARDSVAHRLMDLVSVGPIGFVPTDPIDDARRLKEILIERPEADADHGKTQAALKTEEATETANRKSLQKESKAIKNAEKWLERLETVEAAAQAKQVPNMPYSECDRAFRDSDNELLRAIAAVQRKGGQLYLDPENLHDILSGALSPRVGSRPEGLSPSPSLGEGRGEGELE